jgi:prevent-host-death family protein
VSYHRGLGRTGVREFNQHTSRVIERVKRGKVIEVIERGKPVARVMPGPTALVQGLLDRLVAEGRAVPPMMSGPPPMPPVIGDPTTDAAAGLSKARDEERPFEVR